MKYRVLNWENNDISWQYDAACLGVVARTGDDPFFHNDEVVSGKRPSRVKQAKKFCDVCTVRQQCLDFALENGCLGVWGGTTESERKKIKRRNRLQQED